MLYWRPLRNDGSHASTGSKNSKCSSTSTNRARHRSIMRAYVDSNVEANHLHIHNTQPHVFLPAGFYLYN